MEPIDRLEIFRRSTALSLPDFAISIKMEPAAFRQSLKRKSKVSSETLSNLILAYPDTNLAWVLVGHGDMVMHKKSESKISNQILIEEPDMLYLYDLLDKIDPKEKDLADVKILRRELVRLFNIHSKLKDEVNKLKDLFSKVDL